MTVAELRARLADMPQDAVVMLHDQEFYVFGECLRATQIRVAEYDAAYGRCHVLESDMKADGKYGPVVEVVALFEYV